MSLHIEWTVHHDSRCVMFKDVLDSTLPQVLRTLQKIMIFAGEDPPECFADLQMFANVKRARNWSRTRKIARAKFMGPVTVVNAGSQTVPIAAINTPTVAISPRSLPAAADADARPHKIT
ncbi:hypothetical protein GGX14DRAFT_567483 [Mycena pura]|uniref:Uncharacterized protein n=1 Tax=Mycena pura TaxID=153505 RepID=A0AAD6VAP7_9AGAR|nr:hypothetical protein GGX14DRAFT_567483 [Mycena pura]